VEVVRRGTKRVSVGELCAGTQACCGPSAGAAPRCCDLLSDAMALL
jgi:hypothetical protein